MVSPHLSFSPPLSFSLPLCAAIILVSTHPHVSSSCIFLFSLDFISSSFQIQSSPNSLPILLINSNLDSVRREPSQVQQLHQVQTPLPGLRPRLPSATTTHQLVPRHTWNPCLHRLAVIRIQTRTGTCTSSGSSHSRPHRSAIITP